MRRSEGWDTGLIKKMKSKLSVKVFMMTAVLTAVCCGITYFCILRFAPHIYVHTMDEAEMWAGELAACIDQVSKEEYSYLISDFARMLSEETDEEYVYHIFRQSGEELCLPYLNTMTGKDIADYEGCEKTGSYTFRMWDSKEEYVVFAAKDTELESQAAGALKKALPVIVVIVVLVSAAAAFFYTWYMTGPVKKISMIARQMADMEFDARCEVRRSDEIGVLAGSLNEMAEKLSRALLQLREANGKLQEDIDRERALEQQRLAFFSAASHELKTPITIIKGQLEGMLYQVGRFQDRETYLARSLEVTNTLETMVQELLTVSRIETPGYTCKKSRVDFSRLAAGRLTALSELFLQRELTIETFLSPDIVVMGDARLLEKVLDNLLSNAALYSTAGNHVTVKLWKEAEVKAAEPQKTEIKAAEPQKTETKTAEPQKAETVMLTVENTGVQIPEEALPKLFEAFYRVDESRSRQTGGSGLGLYIVKTILDLHGASVSIANTEQGVTVLVRFGETEPES